MQEGTAPDPRILVILNPGSGSSDTEFREKLEDALKRGDSGYVLRETTEAKDGRALASEGKAEGFERFMACGGDGTVTAVINGLGPNIAGERPCTLIIVPGGTANLVATALSIPDDPQEAVRLADEGTDRDVDLGREEKTLFALGIGVGLTERLVSEASSEAKEKIGRWAYLFAMLKELGAKPQRFELTLDHGDPIRDSGVAVVIANSGEMGHGLSYAPDAKLDDGLLDVCILRRFALPDLFRLAARTLVGRIGDDRAVTFHQAHHIELKAEPPLDVQIDGEAMDVKTPLTVEVLPSALRVRVPKNDCPKVA